MATYDIVKVYGGTAIQFMMADGSLQADAPADGLQYARKNNSWEIVTGGGGGDVISVFGRIGVVTALESDYNTFYGSLADVTLNNAKISFPEAPNDGQQYARQSLGWSVISGGSGGGITEIVTAIGSGLSGGSTGPIVTLGNTDKGSSQNIFKQVRIGNVTQYSASSNNDYLNFVAGANMSISYNATNQQITFTSSAAGGGGGTVVDVSVTSPITISGTSTISPTIGLNLALLSDMTQTAVANDELIILDNGIQKRKAINEFPLSIFSNNLGWTSNSGTVTSVTTSTGLTGSITTSGTIGLYLNGLTAGGTLTGTDYLVAVNGTANNKQLISSIPLSIFLNDLPQGGTGTVTSVAMSVPTGLSIAGSPITTNGTLALSYASGYAIPTTAKQTQWDTAYTSRISSLTTTGSSGAATLVSNVLNIPNYTLVGLGGQPLDGDLTAIANITATSGILKKTAANTWSLDTNVAFKNVNNNFTTGQSVAGNVTANDFVLNGNTAQSYEAPELFEIIADQQIEINVLNAKVYTLENEVNNIKSFLGI